jgi:hypothetical protein
VLVKDPFTGLLVDETPGSMVLPRKSTPRWLIFHEVPARRKHSDALKH